METQVKNSIEIPPVIFLETADENSTGISYAISMETSVGNFPGN